MVRINLEDVNDNNPVLDKSLKSQEILEDFSFSSVGFIFCFCVATDVFF